MRACIKSEIASYVQQFPQSHRTVTRWRAPLTGFADAADPLFNRLKSVVSEEHALPADWLPRARTAVVFFIPFHKEIMKSNVKDRKNSEGWVRAYLETNQLITDLNEHMKRFLGEHGHETTVTPVTHNFDPEKLTSG